MSRKVYPVCIVGSGLAGSECAWQLLKRGFEIAMIEMRPARMSPAHHTAKPAELVCSNSLRSNDIANAVGLLKEEMASLDSVVIRSAYKSRVPAGSALAVDRDVFSDFISEALGSYKNLAKIQDVVVAINKSQDIIDVVLESGESVFCSHVVVATGPLTDEKLATWISNLTGEDSLYFYDSIAPIVEFDSIDMKRAFRGNRYGKGDDNEGDYINCPLSQEQYERFIDEINNAELTPVHDFDKAQFFDGCLPIEEMVRRGRETLRFGPMKPVGFNEVTETPPHAIVQLRQDNVHGTLYNMVGFQTRMKWGEQKRIFKMIPGLENAEFVRLGAMHRNTYLCSPRQLGEGLESNRFAGLYFAGQITGCEGYVESAATGMYVGIYLSKKLCLKNLPLPPQETALGALVHHILRGSPENYQPMNVNFGLFSPLEQRVKKFDKKMEIVKRAVRNFREWCYDHVD